jgi:translation initiation factor 3 subunit A
MKNYLNLCVDLRESHLAKDGLHQYKTICQNVNVKSLEEVINGYLQLAEERAEKAKKDANDANVVDVDDLENLNSPESVLLKAVSGESSQDRADRDVLAPWLKFVWESYKQCLDLLKYNNKVEILYQQVAKQAFAFCVKYQRKTEFRKLCETIRQHMVQGHKYSLQQNASNTMIDLSKPETQNSHLETRLIQLNHAISMELWQEAYKAVEDIYSLMNLSRSKPKPSQMFNYYSKLSLIFWKAGNHLFHAATLQKLFVLLKEQKKTMTADELTKISSRLLLATLAIPIPPNRSLIDECLEQDEVTQDKLKRLSSLLTLQQPPTRQSLIRDLVKYNVVQHVYPELRDLYKWLECEFHPLKLSERVCKCLEFVEQRGNELAVEGGLLQYVQPIKEIAVIRLLKQISQIYTSIEIKRFVALAPNNIDSFLLEKLIVDAAKQLDLQVRLNHQTRSLHFGNELYVAQKEDMPEGPNIQSMPSEQIRRQLISMSEALQQAQELIYGNENKRILDEVAQEIANNYRRTCAKHHVELLRRKQLIEEQKEMYERLALEREQAEAEERRLKQEQERALLSIQSNKLKESAMARGLNEFRQNQQEQDNEQTDDDKEYNKKIEQANREKRELIERLKKEERKYDHFVRACHENEISLTNKFIEEEQQERRKFWEEKEVERIEMLKRELQMQMENCERLQRMLPDKQSFEQLIHSARKEEYEKRLSEFTIKLKQARESKLAERKEKRKIERRIAYYKEIEERKRKEENEKKQRDDEERRRKQDEQAERQRQRDKEIEEKMMKDERETKRERDREVQQRQQQEEPTAKPQFTQRQPRAEPELSWRRGENNEQPDSSAGQLREQGRYRGDRQERQERGEGSTRAPFHKTERNEAEREWRVRDTDKEVDIGAKPFRPPRQQNEEGAGRPRGPGGYRSEKPPMRTNQGPSKADMADNWRSREPQQVKDEQQSYRRGGGERGPRNYDKDRDNRPFGARNHPADSENHHNEASK